MGVYKSEQEGKAAQDKRAADENMANADKTIYEERFAPAREAVEKLLAGDQKILLVAIDGRTGAGKTTIAKFLRKKFEMNLFHMDDFYLQGFQRTPGRLSEIGGNLDYERYKEEVLTPVLQGKTVHYRPFNYLTMDFDPQYAREIRPRRLNVIEGSYCLNPYFGDPYQLRIFMDIAYQDQIKNIISRQGTAELDDYIDKWIPMVDRYIDRFGIEQKCDLTIRF